MEKTVKVRALPESAQDGAQQGNFAEEQALSKALTRKSAQLEEEKMRSLDYIKTIEQLQASLRQEQEKSAELASLAKRSKEFQARIKELSDALDKILSMAATAKEKIG